MATAPKLDTARQAMDPAEEAALLDAIQKWVDKEVRPVVLHHDHNDIWPEELVHQMAEMGLFGATIGQEYGGLGLPATTYAKIVAMISSYWMAITGIFNSHLIMACAVERFGTLEQKMRWLPKFATGEIRGGLALTEPNAGTDLQAIRTTARLCHQWHQDMDFERHQRQLLCVAGEDRSAGRPALQGHEPLHCPKAGWIQRRQEIRQAGLQVHRFRRARV
jgi:hypothetical protein